MKKQGKNWRRRSVKEKNSREKDREEKIIRIPHGLPAEMEQYYAERCKREGAKLVRWGLIIDDGIDPYNGYRADPIFDPRYWEENLPYALVPPDITLPITPKEMRESIREIRSDLTDEDLMEIFPD